MATIFALATAHGRAGIAVVRVSGPGAGPVLDALTGRRPVPRRATRARLCHPVSKEWLDDALILWFPGPASFTGEDLAELHIHGGRAVLEAVTQSVAEIPGVRLAEPGEFSRRAFLNDKMDLTTAEALADLVNAETEAQRRQALRQADGALFRLYEGWRGEAMRLLAHAEALLDFPDEDLPPAVEAEVRAGIVHLRDTLAAHLDDRHRGERLRDGLHVAVIGAPNAGKSSLVNRLARREAAIVSDIAGTTRDVIEVGLDLGGYPLLLADTAGVRETTDVIEAEGVRRALARHAQADLTLVVMDGTRDPAEADPLVGLSGANLLRVFTRADQVAERTGEGIWISCLTGEGFEALEAALERAARALLDETNAPALTRARHRAAVTEAHTALARSLTAPLADLRAEDLRLAVRALGRITGRVAVDDLLDIIFRDFCLGK
ncbi:tRNA uridine-5-carboxymethylaminomethyl(34) synthesis GTPase MnmE [Pararhodospirillum photometricum]|nr:tRNA uridine-5-carboxymethylaminomethyl(34) synthesis GTPase MnmE [Pararhodospirillum photometricum]